MTDRDWIVAERRHARKLLFALAGTLMVLGSDARPRAEEPLRSPGPPGMTRTQSMEPGPPALSSTRSEEENGAIPWLALPPASPPNYTYWPSFGSDVSESLRSGNVFDPNYASPATGPTAPPDQLRMGNSYLGIQTKKNLQVFESLGRRDCDDDDDCAEYSGLPRSEHPKSPVKSFKRPFIGLSITRPLE